MLWTASADLHPKYIFSISVFGHPQSQPQWFIHVKSETGWGEGKSCIRLVPDHDRTRGRTGRGDATQMVREREQRKEESVTWTDPWLSSWPSDHSQDRWMRWTDDQMRGTAPWSRCEEKTRGGWQTKQNIEWWKWK